MFFVKLECLRVPARAQKLLGISSSFSKGSGLSEWETFRLGHKHHARGQA